MEHPEISTFDINGNSIELTGEASAAYHAHKYQLEEVTINLARFGANELHGIHCDLYTRYTRIAPYKDGTPCIIQGYEWADQRKYLTILFNPLTELLNLGVDALSDRVLADEASEGKNNNLSEAYCFTEYGQTYNYPCNVWDSGGDPIALAHIKACPTEISYTKVKKKIRDPFYRPDGYFEL